jgi:hypothetical protein
VRLWRDIDTPLLQRSIQRFDVLTHSAVPARGAPKQADRDAAHHDLREHFAFLFLDVVIGFFTEHLDACVEWSSSGEEPRLA